MAREGGTIGLWQARRSCHIGGVTGNLQQLRLQRRLIDSLYVEAMLLADEARSYFDEDGRDDRGNLDAILRVSFSCESLKVTTRLMHVIAWLLTQRAIDAGELHPSDGLDPSRRLGVAPRTDLVAIDLLPVRARALINASADLHRRVALLDTAQGQEEPSYSPVRSMQQKLALAF